LGLSARIFTHKYENDIYLVDYYPYKVYLSFTENESYKIWKLVKKMKFIAVHKWPKEEQIACTKDMVAGFTALLKGETPKDIIIQNTWTRDDYGAFCCWDAPNKEALTNLFKQYLPTMLKYTEFIPVSQAFPATIEYELGLLKMMCDAAK